VIGRPYRTRRPLKTGRSPPNLMLAIITMTEQENGLAKRGRGRPATGRGWTIGVRLHPDALARLDAWIAGLPDKPSRPEAIRRLISEALKTEAIGPRST
jgi:hypothetical protein